MNGKDKLYIYNNIYTADKKEKIKQQKKKKQQKPNQKSKNDSNILDKCNVSFFSFFSFSLSNV